LYILIFKFFDSRRELVLAIAVILGFESRRIHDHTLLSQIVDYRKPEVQVQAFISRMKKVAKLYPQTLGSLFVASYDSQICCGGIETHLHAVY
jgi:hypothetical protein